MSKLQTKVYVAVRQAIEECSDWKNMCKLDWLEVEDTIKEKIKCVFSEKQYEPTFIDGYKKGDEQ